jgi:hypothetical protein
VGLPDPAGSISFAAAICAAVRASSIDCEEADGAPSAAGAGSGGAPSPLERAARRAGRREAGIHHHLAGVGRRRAVHADQTFEDAHRGAAALRAEHNTEPRTLHARHHLRRAHLEGILRRARRDLEQRAPAVEPDRRESVGPHRVDGEPQQRVLVEPHHGRPEVDLGAAVASRPHGLAGAELDALPARLPDHGLAAADLHVAGHAREVRLGGCDTGQHESQRQARGGRPRRESRATARRMADCLRIS